jgi:hypothetical protein
MRLDGFVAPSFVCRAAAMPIAGTIEAAPCR